MWRIYPVFRKIVIIGKASMMKFRFTLHKQAVRKLDGKCKKKCGWSTACKCPIATHRMCHRMWRIYLVFCKIVIIGKSPMMEVSLYPA